MRGFAVAAFLGLGLSLILLLNTDGMFLPGFSGLLAFLGLGLILALVIFALGALALWLLDILPVGVWTFVVLGLLGLSIVAGQWAHKVVVRTFTKGVQIEAEWQDLEGDSSAYTAIVYNHMGRTMSFDCTLTATPLGEPGLDITDTFSVGPLQNNTSRTVRGEVLPNRPIPNGVEVLPDLSAECTPS